MSTSGALFHQIKTRTLTAFPSVCIETSYGLDRPRFKSRQEQEILFSPRTVQNGSGAHPASYSMITRVLSLGWRSQRVKLTTHLHLVPRVRMNGGTLLLPLYAFMPWAETTLPLYCQLAFLHKNTSFRPLCCLCACVQRPPLNFWTGRSIVTKLGMKHYAIGGNLQNHVS